MSSTASASSTPGVLLRRAWRNVADVLTGPGWLLFLLWSGYSAWVFLHATATVHDENDFLKLVDIKSFRTFLTQAPPALYGSLFWVGLKLCGSALVARVVVLAMFVATPYLVLRTVAAPSLRLAVLLLWISFPIAWWTGKLIAPEIPSMFLCALALYWLHRERFLGAAVALGVAVALKISALPAVGFLGLAILLRSDLTPRAKLVTFAKASVVFLLVLIVACPTIFAIVHELRKTPGQLSLPNLLTQAGDALMIDRWEWDAVFSGGVLRFSLLPLPLLLVAGVTLLRDWRMFVAAGVTACLYLLMSMNSAAYYGWYCITLFPIVLYAASRDHGKAVHAVVPGLLCLAAIVNLGLQLDTIGGQASQKFEQIRTLAHRDAVQACLRERLGQLKPAIVLNLTDFDVTGMAPQVYKGPNPSSDMAPVHLIGTRFLIGRRQPNAEWPGPKHFYASCDAVLIFTRD